MPNDMARSEDATLSRSPPATKSTRHLPKSAEPPQIDEDSREQVESGVASTVDRARIKDASEEERYVAIKAAAGRKRFSPEPHDILKEIAILSTLNNPNIIYFLGSRRDRFSDLIELYTPWIAYPLEDLLDNPTFTPSPYPTEIKHLVLPLSFATPSRASLFEVLAKSITYQVALALDYLHGLDPPVGHRDIKPRNVLLTETGCVKVIDFGIAYQKDICAAPENLWPEKPENMYNDVATGPFRAPELIFGPITYSAPATDLWSFGATLAHFFTPLKLQRKSYGYDDDDEDDPDSDNEGAMHNDSSYILPKDVDSITFRSAEWIRKPLFDAHRGSIGLAWSIFSLRGTPEKSNWPTFDDLPDANKIQFKVVPCIDLKCRLPNLPSGIQSTGSSHKPPEKQSPTPLDLIHRLLVYPPGDRMKASDVLQHLWFSANEDAPLLLPRDFPSIQEGTKGGDWDTLWHGEDLRHWLNVIFRSQR